MICCISLFIYYSLLTCSCSWYSYTTIFLILLFCTNLIVIWVPTSGVRAWTWRTNLIFHGNDSDWFTILKIFVNLEEFLSLRNLKFFCEFLMFCVFHVTSKINIMLLLFIHFVSIKSKLWRNFIFCWRSWSSSRRDSVWSFYPHAKSCFEKDKKYSFGIKDLNCGFM